MSERDYRRAMRYAGRFLLAEYRSDRRAELPWWVVADMLSEDGRESDADILREAISAA